MQMGRRRLLGLVPLLGVTACGGKAPADLPSGVPDGVTLESIPGASGAADISGLRFETDRLQPAAPEASGKAMQAFTAKFWNALSNTDSNLAVSPYSLAAVLNIVGMGADGKLLEQYKQTLGGDMDSVATQLSAVESAIEQAAKSGAEDANMRKQEQRIPGWRAVNALFMNSGITFNKEFLRRAYAGLGASGYQTNFSADPEGTRKAINAFVEKQTNDLIKELLPEGKITKQTALVALNTLWLKFAWNREASELSEGIDFKKKDASVNVPAIVLKDAGRYAEGPGWRSATAFLIGQGMGVTFVLPDQWPQKLTLEMITAACNAEFSKVEVTAPKFKVSGTLDLEEPMAKMGLPDAFSIEYPNFTDSTLKLSTVLQKCVVSLDENGIEAAAATAAEMELTSAPGEEVVRQIVLDRPFWFIVHDSRTNSPLFVGSVADPN